MNFVVAVQCLFFIHTTLGWKLESRIVGGINTSDGDFPFIISQRILNKHNCGGTILNEKYILTAAHCVYEWINQTQYLSIQYGTAKIDPKGPNIVKVKNVIVHEEWNSSIAGFYNDLAILEVEETIPFGANVYPVELPDVNEAIPDLETISLLGWGLLASNGPKPTQLQYTEILVYFDYYCLILQDMFDPNYQFCGGLVEGGAGQCSGDSGGPALVNGKQVGVISWSVKPCASPGNPGIFVRISSYRRWIYNHTGV